MRIQNNATMKKGASMPTLVPHPTTIKGSGNKPIVIAEYIGRVNSQHDNVSIAYLRCPDGWFEPGQAPEFDEFTIVLRGVLRVTHRSGFIDISAGQAVITHRGDWVQYSTPQADGADYLAVCLPAF